MNFNFNTFFLNHSKTKKNIGNLINLNFRKKFLQK